MTFNQQNYNSSNKRKLPSHAIDSIKSPNKNSLQIQSKISERLQNEINKCVNHPLKQAQYMSESKNEEQKILYCQRCAILLASQGFNVVKLNGSIINTRKDQVDNFLKKIKGLNEDALTKKEQIRQILINSEQFYGSQIEQINQYFNLVYQSLQLEKNKCYNYILNERTNSQASARKISSQIDYLTDEIKQIIQDIQESLNVVYEIQQAAYRPVIVSYQNKFYQYQKALENLVISPIQMKKIQFTGVPDSIYSLSQILIKNTIDNLQPESSSHSKLQDKVNSLMFSFEGQSLPIGHSQETLRGYLKMWD